MTDPKSQEMQSELFTEFSKETKKPDRFPGVVKTHKPILWNTTVEHLILLGIGLILLCCFIFFLGVIRGKSLNSTPAADSYAVPAQAAVQVPRAAVASPAARQAAPQATPAVTAPKTTPAVSQKDNPKKPYTIQLVTYKKKDLAQKEVATFRKAGYYSTVIPSGDYFLVCVGQYTNIDEARKDLKTFGARYKDCFLRRR
jgi:septal ring-binding cell division protein DamX